MVFGEPKTHGRVRSHVIVRDSFHREQPSQSAIGYGLSEYEVEKRWLEYEGVQEAARRSQREKRGQRELHEDREQELVGEFAQARFVRIG